MIILNSLFSNTLFKIYYTLELINSNLSTNERRLYLMYVVKVLHGYITPNGYRTLFKSKARLFQYKSEAEEFASKIGGRVNKVE